MKCHPEYLISEWLFHRRISTCENGQCVQAHVQSTIRSAATLLQDARCRSEEVNLDPGVNLVCRRVIRSYFWAAFVPAMYPATAPATTPTTADVTRTPHGQTGHANNPTKRLICVLLPQSS